MFNFKQKKLLISSAFCFRIRIRIRIVLIAK